VVCPNTEFTICQIPTYAPTGWVGLYSDRCLYIHVYMVFISFCRWIARLDSIDTMYDLFEAAVECLDAIRSDNTFNSDSISKANDLYHCMKQSDFIVFLVVCKELLAYTRGLTTKLQVKKLEAYHAYKDIDFVLSTLKKVREEIESNHNKWFDTATELAQKVDTLLTQPRISACQQGRVNVPAETPEEYFRRALSIPFVDYLVVELQDCFSEGKVQ